MGTARALDGPTEVGTGLLRKETVVLSRLIDIVNDRFGTDFNQADQLFFDQIVEEAITDERLKEAAEVNPEDKFELVFKNLLETLFVERIDQNEEIFVRFMNDAAFQRVVTEWMASEAYSRLRGKHQQLTVDRATELERSGLRIVRPRTNDKFVTCVPLVPLKAVAGGFGDSQHFDKDKCEWVEVQTRRHLQKGMFVVQVIGASMEPVIADGSYGLFRSPVLGTREGKIVIVELLDKVDPDTGERYTIKQYSSSKKQIGDSWQHSIITLRALNPNYKSIELSSDFATQVKVIAELLEVLRP